MKNEIKLKPIYYASVSGGKDSLYMLNLILNMPDKYPLDMVVNFELEIDWPWAKQVVDYMENRCKRAGINFVRIKPRKTWNELYEENDIPLRLPRLKWCNNLYKLDCKKQLNEWIEEQNCRPVAYIGLCADEKKRFKYNIGEWEKQEMCYPLAEEGICERVIYEWVKNIPLFNGWYKLFYRQGCMICPNATRLHLAYLYKYYPQHYTNWFDKIKLYEKRFNKYFWDKPAEEIDKIVKTKWLLKLNEMESEDIQ